MNFMWFKNLHIYQLSKPFSFSTKEFSDKLNDFRFNPCGKMSDKSIGWVSPIHRHRDYLIHAASGCILFCMRKEQKMLPASAVKEALEEKVFELEEEFSRKVYRKEKQSIKEDIIALMLPKAFPRSSHIHAYFDTINNRLFINASSAAQVDEFYELLTNTIGSFGAIQLVAEENPASVMSQWIKTQPPENWQLSGEYLLKDPKDERVARFKDQTVNDVGSENHFVNEFIDDGYVLQKLGIRYKSYFRALIQDELQIKSIKFDDELIKENDELNGEDELARFDADFALMTDTLKDFTDDLIKIFKVNSGKK
ncbi:MAG: recombination-associated protein RdgC [Kangiella sp.]|nr:MAG: recombination-associated protein RdgC [Kangiella sp.]